MKYARLGGSGLKVSRVALGCMSFGIDSPHYAWALDDTSAEPVFRLAVEHGVNFWDTANVYSGGTSEEIVGRAVKKYSRREAIVLATKVYQKMHDGPGGSGTSRKAVMENIDASLRRLGTDYVDLYQIHRFDPDTPAEETMEALHDIVRAGKARYIGASSMRAWQFAKLQHIAEMHGWTKFVSMQDQYSLLQREEEREMFPLLADQGVGSIPWSPLGGGLLARPWGEKGTPRSASSPTADSYGRKAVFETDEAVVDAVERIAGYRDVPMAQIALAWVLRNPVVDAPIIGATKEKHLADAIAAVEVQLAEEEVSALEEHYALREPTFFA